MSFEASFAIGILLLKSIISSSVNNIITNISLIQSIPKCMRNLHEVISIFIKASRATHKNRYRKFLTLGTETSMDSSVGDSFFIIKYALYQISRARSKIHSRRATCWSHSIIKINAVTHNRNAQSL